ncbi:hypothetical protein FDP41_010082 [Naegleria fowleri]|uniref:Uncharacterized protein n=1 Tax=Naegleria fowleri TaxID=5763 RepID=A0A6A5BFL9_NAEFO|nr:uncharacterized protein FDP41_010082 [Naegleria fowleri]KAF0971859.1 hypothetical protein FDP41_010082 [Naegleria fowleri]
MTEHNNNHRHSLTPTFHLHSKKKITNPSIMTTNNNNNHNSCNHPTPPTPQLTPPPTTIKQPKKLRQEINTHAFKQNYFELDLHSGDGVGGVGGQVEVLRFQTSSTTSPTSSQSSSSNLSSSKICKRFQQRFRSSDLSLEVPKKSLKKKRKKIQPSVSNGDDDDSLELLMEPSTATTTTTTWFQPQPSSLLTYSQADSRPWQHGINQQPQDATQVLIPSESSRKGKEDDHLQVEPPKKKHFKSTTTMTPTLPPQQQVHQQPQPQLYQPHHSMNEVVNIAHVSPSEKPLLQPVDMSLPQVLQWLKEMQQMQQQQHDERGFQASDQHLVATSHVQNFQIDSFIPHQNHSVGMVDPNNYGTLFGYEYLLQKTTTPPNSFHQKTMYTAIESASTRNENRIQLCPSMGTHFVPSTYGIPPNKEEVESCALQEAWQRWLKENSAERSGHVQQVMHYGSIIESCDLYNSTVSKLESIHNSQSLTSNLYPITSSSSNEGVSSCNLSSTVINHVVQKEQPQLDECQEGITNRNEVISTWAGLYLAIQQALKVGGPSSPLWNK